MSVREASLRYDILKSALNRGREVSLQVLQPKIGRFTSTFLPEYVEVLVEHVEDSV